MISQLTYHESISIHAAASRISWRLYGSMGNKPVRYVAVRVRYLEIYNKVSN